MTNEEIVHLGTYAESVMRDDSFVALTAIFEAQTVQNILNTAAGATEAREQAYHDYAGLRAFLSLMRSLVEQKTAIIMQAQAPSEDVPENIFDKDLVD